MKKTEILLMATIGIWAFVSTSKAEAPTNAPSSPTSTSRPSADPGDAARRKRADELNQRAKDRRAARVEKARLSTLSTLAGMRQGTNILAKYDLNHDGWLDAHEWMLLRRDLLKLQDSIKTGRSTNSAVRLR